jgi:signal transduction histidine kinase/ABC-type amino acid transport substrate-binding protein
LRLSAWRPGALVRWLVALAATVLSAAAPAATPVSVGVYANPPKVVAAPGTEPSGIYVEILRHVAAQEDWQLRYVHGTFQQGLERLRRGEIDLMVDVGRSADREPLYDFNHEVVLQSWNVVYARPGSDIRNLLDLSGRRVAVLAGSVQEKFFQREADAFGIKATLLAFPTYEAAFDAVRKGAADAVVSNPFYAGLRSAGLEETSIIFGSTGLYFATAKGRHPELLRAIDHHLLQLKAEPGSLYFDAFRRLQAVQRVERTPPWVYPATAVGAAFLCLSLAWAYTLRRAAARLRRAETKQRELAQETQRVFDNSLDVILVLGPDLRILRISPSVRRFGWDPDALVGRYALDGVAPSSRPAALALLEGVRDGRALASQSAVMRRKGGGLAPTTFSAIWVPETQEMYCSVHDETERMALLAEVEGRNKALAAANEDLQIVGFSLSHDLRAPVAAVRGFLDAALDGLDAAGSAALPTREARLLRRSQAAAERMDAMVDDLAALLKVAGEPLHVAPCDFSRLAGEVVQALRERSEHAPAVRIQGGMQVAGDARLLKLALENLVGNAWKFTGKTPAALLEIGQLPERESGERVFFVRDNGAGFDMAHAANRLFRPFTRLHGHDEFPGSGMGLSIVQKIVHKHRGRVWAESAPDLGTVVYVAIPPLAATHAADRPSGEAPSGPIPKS